MASPFDLEIDTAPDLYDAVRSWQTWLKVEKNVSKHTFRAYTSDLGQFLNFLRDHYDDEVGLSTLSSTTLTDFRSWLSRKSMDGLVASSRARSLSGVKNFISWLENQKIRLYKIEERAKLDNVENETEWPVAFAKYLTDLQLTHLDASKDRAYIIEQLLSHAIRLEYSDNSKWSLLL
jgi:site-specific recombinase XerD